MAKKTKDSNLSIEERLEQALISNWDEPYKLPPNWCWVKLSSVSIFERGITFPASAKESLRTTTNIPCLRTANVQESLKLDDLLYVDKSYIKDNSNKLVREKDIIMSTANSRELVGKTSFVHSLTEEMTFGGFIMAIRSKIDPKYLFYFLRLQFLNGKFMGNSTQTTNIANINSATLGETETPIPPLEEQKRIVVHIESLFAKLDEAKEKAQEVVDGFETRKAAILHKAFSGELTAKWREANGIKSNSWELIKLQDVCEKIVCGKTPTEYIAEHGEVPFLKVYNIVDNQIDFETTPQFIPKSIHHGKLKSSGLKPNDVIMNIVGPPLRKIAIIPDTYPEWNMNQAIVRFRPTEALNHKFLYYALINPETLDEVIAATRGVVGQANISVSQSRSLTMNMPSWDEQIEVVRILDCIIEKEIYTKDSAIAVIDQIDTMKKAILARAFRGELGTNDPSEESALELLKRVLESK